MAECKHRMRYDDPQVGSNGGWSIQGLICKKCGFQTVAASSYIPTEKACPSCDTQFSGMPAADGELCEACVGANIEAFIETIKSCPHKNLRRGLCGDCGTGTHGPHQWRWQLLQRIEDLRLRAGVG